jgi:hypothetical protein
MLESLAPYQKKVNNDEKFNFENVESNFSKASGWVGV